MPPKQRAAPSRNIPGNIPDSQEEGDEDIERPENQMAQRTAQHKQMQDLQQQIKQITDANTQQQARQQAFEEKMILLVERLTSTPTPTPQPEQPIENTQHTIELSKAYTTIPTVDKLKGRSNYKTWTINIERVAKGCDVWTAFIASQPQLSQYKQDFALSIIIINVVPSIQSTLSEYPTAYKAWRALQKQYNTQTISNIAGILRTLHTLNYDSFETIETFQQRFTNLAQQITDFTKTPQDALQAIFTGLLLNAIGRADLSVQASLENNINSKLVPEGQSSIQYIFQTLNSYKRLLKDRPTVNAAQNTQCTYCEKQHRGTCYVQYPERAPEHQQEMFRRLHEQHNRDRSPTRDLVASKTASSRDHSPIKTLQ